ncbi:MAG: hypothetical protein U1F33_00325 [Alphaproteobacteria bacterium]
MVLILIAMLAAEARAQTGPTPCPPVPATVSNGETLGAGWQVWIEGASEARVEAWANGLAFFLPDVSGSAAATELQCVARVPAAGGQLVTVEARKALDGRYRCSFAKGTFNCAR